MFLKPELYGFLALRDEEEKYYDEGDQDDHYEETWIAKEEQEKEMKERNELCQK